MSKDISKHPLPVWSQTGERFSFIAFVVTTILAIGGFLFATDTHPQAVPVLSALLSIGTSGVVAFIFYYVVSARIDRRRIAVIRSASITAYQNAKRSIALSVIHASQRGGRQDLEADTDTVDKCLTPPGFRELFEGGQEGDEGFYAFQNQMSDETYEFSEIMFNLRIIEAAAERLIASGALLDADIYKQLVGLSHIVRRIRANGAGYDESKRLCQFIWEIFAGWNWREGQLDHDPIERAFLEAS